MKRAEVLTNWTNMIEPISGEFINLPRLLKDYVTHAYHDASGRPTTVDYPDPNQLVAYVECEDDVMLAIETDPNCFVLWTEEKLSE